MLTVHKFGGTSLGSKVGLSNIAQILNEYSSGANVLVVSALSPLTKEYGLTNLLLKLVKDFNNDEVLQQINETLTNFIDSELLFVSTEFSLPFLSHLSNYLKTLSCEDSFIRKENILSYGEYVSAYCLTSFLENKGIESELVDLSKIIPYKISENYVDFNRLKNDIKDKVLSVLEKSKIPVVTGFIGVFPKGILNQVGRGYTDYTSSLVASTLQANNLIIWKEIDGIYTANPKIVKNSRKIKTIGINNAFEMSVLGSEVVHINAINEAVKHNINVEIKNTFNYTNSGTLVTNKDFTSKNSIASIVLNDKLLMFNLNSTKMLGAVGFIRKIGEVFDKYGVAVDLITTSQVNVSLTVSLYSFVDEGNIKPLYSSFAYQKIKKELEEFSTVSINTNVGMISLVGNFSRTKGLKQDKLFSFLKKQRIKVYMISQDANSSSLSVVISSKKINYVLCKLHDVFFSRSKFLDMSLLSQKLSAFLSWLDINSKKRCK